MINKYTKIQLSTLKQLLQENLIRFLIHNKIQRNKEIKIRKKETINITFRQIVETELKFSLEVLES